jgi:hypothetical protein
MLRKTGRGGTDGRLARTKMKVHRHVAGGNEGVRVGKGNESSRFQGAGKVFLLTRTESVVDEETGLQKMNNLIFP